MSALSGETERVILVEGMGNVRSVVEVVRRTKTQIVVRGRHGERRFNAKSLREVGADSWAAASLDTATPERLAAVRDEVFRRVLVARIRSKDLQTLTTAQLEAIAKVLDT